MSLDKLLAKLKEPSTWRGIIALAALAGWQLDPEQIGAISQLVIAGIAVYEVFRREK